MNNKALQGPIIWWLDITRIMSDMSVTSQTNLKEKRERPFFDNDKSALIITEWHEPRKKPSYFPLYWMFNEDPYNGLL